MFPTYIREFWPRSCDLYAFVFIIYIHAKQSMYVVQLCVRGHRVSARDGRVMRMIKLLILPSPQGVAFSWGKLMREPRNATNELYTQSPKTTIRSRIAKEVKYTRIKFEEKRNIIIRFSGSNCYVH